jgi:hypothetical protein
VVVVAVVVVYTARGPYKGTAGFHALFPLSGETMERWLGLLGR